MDESIKEEVTKAASRSVCHLARKFHLYEDDVIQIFREIFCI
jgi:hypothetical protein